MMHYMWKNFAVVAALCSVACSHISSHVVYEERIESSLWIKGMRVLPNQLLPMRIGLMQQNLDRGEELLLEVSDPASTKYGQFYTSDEVVELFAPSEETVAKVRGWLVSEGIHDDRITHSDNRGWLAFDATTAEAERLLDTQFFHFHHKANHERVACDRYSVPSHISSLVDYVTPGVRLLAPNSRRPLEEPEKKQRKRPPFAKGFPRCKSGLRCCDELTLPECLRKLYSLPTLEEQLRSKPSPNGSLGVYEYLLAYNQVDLDRVFSRFAPWVPNGTHPKQDSIDGGTHKAPPRGHLISVGEPTLDFSLAIPLNYPQGVVDFQTDRLVVTEEHADGRLLGPSSIFQDFLDGIDGSYCSYRDPKIDYHYPDKAKGGYKGKLQCGVFKPTNVITMSYGGPEHFLPASYQKRQCHEFMKLGLQGVSVLAASGDYGAAGIMPQLPNFYSGCQTVDKHKVFAPTYPGNCPFVTSVGATMIKKGNSVSDPEVAVFKGHRKFGNYTSAGGFSNFYSAPKYQAAALSTYFTKHPPKLKSYNGYKNLGKNGGVFNRNGRGFPDVSANGLRIPISVYKQYLEAEGTSASAPIFASVINTIVDKRLKMGKKPLGLLNPALYSHPHLLNDITEGYNQGCNHNGRVAFDAVEGWDPVTGLGTPNYEKLEKFFLSLP